MIRTPSEGIKNNPFPVEAIKARIEELEDSYVQTVLEYCNRELKDGKRGIDTIDSLKVLNALVREDIKSDYYNNSLILAFGKHLQKHNTIEDFRF